MTETTFYLVRHGETEYNRQRIVQGRGVDTPLNGTGRRQAEAVAQRLAEVPLDVMYTSTLRRAIQTAEPIVRTHPDVPIYRLADLEEMGWGVFEGTAPSSQRRAAFEDMYARWHRGEFDFRIEGGESILDVQARGRRAMRHILDRHRGKTILVVTHGRYLRVLLATLLEDYGLERMHEIEHTNTGVNKLTLRDDCFEANLLNCTAHLEASELLNVS